MDEIGSILLEAREAKGLSLSEVHDKLRISPKFLAALEEGQYGLLPSSTHVRGYLRNYARFLGLDPTPLLERYEAVRDQRPAHATHLSSTSNGIGTKPEPTAPSPIPPIGEPETGTFFNPVNVDLGRSQAGGSDWVGRLIVVALLVVIAIIGWRFTPLIVNGSVESVPGDFTTAVNDILNGDLEEPAEDGSPSVQLVTPITNTLVITPTGRTAGSNAVVATPPAPTRSPLPATMETIELELLITERTWLRVVADGITVYEGQAEKDEVLSWAADEAIQLRTGNAAGIAATINGIDLGRLGGRGQIFDETWETTR